MTLPRTDVIPGLLAELEAFGELIGPLDDRPVGESHALRRDGR